MEGRDPKASTRRARSAWTARTAERDLLTAPQPRRPSGHRPLRRSHRFSPGGRLHRAARTRALADGMESATTAARAQSTRTAPSGPTASIAARGPHVESTPPGLPLRPLPLRRHRRFSQMGAQGCRAPTPALYIVATMAAAHNTTSRTHGVAVPATTIRPPTTASVRTAALVRSTRPALGAPTATTAGNRVGSLPLHPRRRHRPLHLRRRRHHRHRHVHLRHRRHHRRRHRRHRHRRHPHRHHLNHRRHPSRHRHDRRRRIRGSSASRRASPRGGRRAAPRTHGHAILGAHPPQTRVQAALLMEPFTSSQKQTALRSGIPSISTMTARPARADLRASRLRTA